MSAVDAIRAGHLDEALRILQQEVRSQPAQQKHRVFLFQLLAIKGAWERALVQLNVAGELDVANLHMMHAYREVLQCEALRQDIFDAKHSPLVFGDPQAWIAGMVDALRLDALTNYQDAHALRSAALEAAPASSGSINGERFAWIADADSRLGPVLEVLVNGRYYWVPFSRLKSLRAEAPVDLRDRVWMPVRLVWANEGEAVGFVPTRYVGTTASEDNELLLARKTVWHSPIEEVFFGLGQRMLTTDAGDYPLMDVRSIDFDIVPALPEAAQESAQ